MKTILLAVATVVGVAVAATVSPAPAPAQDISIRFGSGNHWRGGDHWRGDDYRVRRGHRLGRHFASCRTVIRERRGPIVIKKVIHHC